MRRLITLAGVFLTLALVPAVQAQPLATAAKAGHTRAGDLRWGHKQHMKALRRIAREQRQDNREQAHRLASMDTPLVECIIRVEGAGPTTTNSSGHMGIGQWDLGTWIGDGGRRFAGTPLGASYSQQKLVIEEQVAAGNAYGHWLEWEPGTCNHLA